MNDDPGITPKSWERTKDGDPIIPLRPNIIDFPWPSHLRRVVRCQAYVNEGRPDRGEMRRCHAPALYRVQSEGNLLVCGNHRRAYLHAEPLEKP